MTSPRPRGPGSRRRSRVIRAFCDKHIAPHHKEWEDAGIVPRDLWLEAGKQGLLGTDVPEQYGGGGVADFR